MQKEIVTTGNRIVNPATGLFENTFGIGTYVLGDTKVPGLVRADGQAINLSDLYRDTHEIFEDWDRNFDALVDLVDNRSRGFRVRAGETPQAAGLSDAQKSL